MNVTAPGVGEAKTQVLPSSVTYIADLYSDGYTVQVAGTVERIAASSPVAIVSGAVSEPTDAVSGAVKLALVATGDKTTMSIDRSNLLSIGLSIGLSLIPVDKFRDEDFNNHKQSGNAN